MTWLYNESLMQVLWYFSVVLVMLSLWRCVVKCACSVWMHGVFIVWNLLEDMTQLQPHYHTSRAFAWRLSLCTKTVSLVNVLICIFIYCYSIYHIPYWFLHLSLECLSTAVPISKGVMLWLSVSVMTTTFTFNGSLRCGIVNSNVIWPW